MSDTTAYVAGCATTGVAVLVLLVARGGLGTQERTDPIEPVQPVPAMPVPTVPEPEPEWEADLREELDAQRTLTTKLESQLAQQEVIARNLENQLRQQQEETRAVLSQMGEYQRSVDSLSVRNDELAQTRRDESLQTTLLWIGGGVLLVIVLGGGALVLCMLFLTASQRRSEQPVSMVYPLQMPTPPSYRYYEQEFLPPTPRRTRPPVSRDYDYEA